MGKAAPPPQPGVYRDDPDRDDAASTSSAVLLEDIDYPDEELPAYTDEPAPVHHQIDPVINVVSNSAGLESHHEVPPLLPSQTHDYSGSSYRTTFPLYSHTTDALYNMIRQQALYPPQYIIELTGTHEETRRNGNKETKDKVTDFFIRLNITDLLVPRQRERDEILQLLPDNKRGYRGGRIISLKPNVSNDVESTQSVEAGLLAWCEKYVQDKAGVKSFTFKREVTNHDIKKLEQLLRGAIQETNYRGHVNVNFGLTHRELIVYSPGYINTWRTITWLRWVFYISMLWIITWPLLILLTVRYEIVKGVYPYANEAPGGDERYRICTVMNEVDWFRKWESAIRRAALARMQCPDSFLTEDYRRQTEEADQRGREQAMGARREEERLPSTGSAFADGALGFLARGARIAGEYNESRGWGGDC